MIQTQIMTKHYTLVTQGFKVQCDKIICQCLDTAQYGVETCQKYTTQVYFDNY